MKKIKVLVVDDSFFMRKAISTIISNEYIEVIGTAVNGKDGVEKTIELNPDVITMDVEMPIMNGLEALKEIMEKAPTPVIMLSTLTSEGANLTIEALSYGALDFITKKNAFNEMDSIRQELVSKIMDIKSNSDIKNQLKRRTSILHNKRLSETVEQESIRPQYASRSTKSNVKIDYSDIKIIIIGISTGGPVALMDFVPKLKPNLRVPIVIAQHMPPHFTKSLAIRLDSNSKIKVKEAEDNEKVLSGWIYIAPGGIQTRVQKNGRILLNNLPVDELYKPSVNVLCDSSNDSFSRHTLCIIMTGMGKDGSEACARLKAKGGIVVAQELSSCVVQGMPSAVISAKLADEIISLSDMADFINIHFA